uniref:Protein kinase domain-containing protein n=1 Tax=Oryza brachyantha TaxID=4533 RepID=J3LY48_ORYBR
MSPPPPPHRLLLAPLASLLLLSPPLLLASSSFPLPTIAIAATTNSSSPTTQKHLLACALVASGAASRVSCASVSNRSAAPHVYSYGSGDGTSSPFSAVVAGDGYLCSAGPTSSPPMSMRWWDLNEGHDESKRVYRGEVLSAVSGGGESVCGLVGETMQCWRCPWGQGEASPPPALAQKQFVALEAKGKVVCGVLMSDYSLQCWGGGVAGGARKVFDRVLPGPCAPSKSCSCGVWSGSAELCGGGSDVSVCYPCGYTPPQMALAPASNSSSTSQSKGKHRPSNLVIALISAGAGSGLVALLAAVVVVYYLRRHRGSSSPVSGRIHAEPTGPAVPRVERRLSALLSKGPNTTVEQFPLAALRAATEFFSPAQRIGSGSFGAVYRASLPDGREVAIKRAERRDTGGPSSSSAAAARRIDHEAAFVSELALLSRVNHKNLH